MITIGLSIKQIFVLAYSLGKIIIIKEYSKIKIGRILTIKITVKKKKGKISSYYTLC
jgi:hypothetical protein